MAYYPKNKINTNRVATATMVDENGIKFQYLIPSTQQIYEGYYYILSNGKAYTGKYPGDGKNELLIYLKISNYEDNVSYSGLTYTSAQQVLAPTEEDYKKGFFIRYFYKKRNEFIFQVLTKEEYNNANDPKKITFTFYKPFFIKWMISGDIKDITKFNQYSIIKAEENEGVLGLNEFLKMNYLQYYKFAKEEDLYTNGKEFVTYNGKIYIGPYHIHPDKGYMVGARHTSASYEILLPINSIMNAQMSTNNFNTRL